MNKKLMHLFVLFMLFSLTVYGNEQFPNNKIKGIKTVELQVDKSVSFEKFKSQDLEQQKKYSGLWSTLNRTVNLDKLSLTTSASSTLGNNYKSNYLVDGKINTAWVEGTKGDGSGEWIRIKLDAFKASESSTPFSISEIGIIPGYSRSKQTWMQNNRIKTLLAIIQSPLISYPKEHEWTAFRLRLHDENSIQFFKIPDELIETNSEPMTKTVWLKIEEVYKGTKYNDTCISEVVFIGGCLP